MAKPILDPTKKYTFRDYFELPFSCNAIAEALGYSLATRRLPTANGTVADSAKIFALQGEFYELLPRIGLNSEIAKRDFMIAPVLWEVMRQVDAKIEVEYPVEVDDRLGGSLDYLLYTTQRLVVIEAKKGDIDRGFNQLVAQLIALDLDQSGLEADALYGAVSIGELWRFGILDRRSKHIDRDLHTYRVPEDLEAVFVMLLAFLRGTYRG